MQTMRFKGVLQQVLAISWKTQIDEWSESMQPWPTFPDSQSCMGQQIEAHDFAFCKNVSQPEDRELL